MDWEWIFSKKSFLGGNREGEKSGVNVGNGITNMKGKEDANVASEKEKDDAMVVTKRRVRR